jgi:hypothetical protein
MDGPVVHRRSPHPSPSTCASRRLVSAFTILNPKHIALTVAAMIAIAEVDVTTGTAIALLAVFVAFSSLGVAVPVFYFLVGGEGAKTTLGKWRDWLGANNAAILAVLFLVFGVLLVSKGIGDLLG